MRRFIVAVLAVLMLTTAIAWAVPLTPGLGIAPGPVRQLTSWHVVGGFQLSSTTITIGSSATWYPIHNATDNLWVFNHGHDISISGDNVIFANAGHYFGGITIAVSGTSGDDIFIRAFNVTDNTAQGFTIGATTTGAANFIPISFPLHFEAAANDKFRFEIMNNTAGRDVTVRSSVFFLNYVHD